MDAAADQQRLNRVPTHGEHRVDVKLDLWASIRSVSKRTGAVDRLAQSMCAARGHDPYMGIGTDPAVQISTPAGLVGGWQRGDRHILLWEMWRPEAELAYDELKPLKRKDK